MEFYGIILGSKTNALQCDTHGKVLFWDTEREARAAGKRRHAKFHVVPIDLKTILRKNGDLIALAILGAADRCVSVIADMSAKLDKVLEQRPRLTT